MNKISRTIKIGNNKYLFQKKQDRMSHISVADTEWARDDLRKQFQTFGAKMICFAQERHFKSKTLKFKELRSKAQKS